MPGTRPRPSVNVFYQCCRVYARVFLNPVGITVSHCPKCLRRLEVVAADVVRGEEARAAGDVTSDARRGKGRTKRRGGFWA